jgi:hypothetical protein
MKRGHMQKVTTRLAITLLTFSAGVAATGLWAPRRPTPAEEASAPVPVATEAEIAPSAPGAWKRVDIGAKVSFSLPPGMKELPPDYLHGVDRAYITVEPAQRRILYLNYTYGRQAACDSDADFPNKEISQKSEVIIGGKKARLNIWQTERAKYEASFSTFPEMTLCFPNLGRGKTGLHLRAIAMDPEGLEAARQIFDTIEFH